MRIVVALVASLLLNAFIAELLLEPCARATACIAQPLTSRERTDEPSETIALSNAVVVVRPSPSRRQRITVPGLHVPLRRGEGFYRPLGSWTAGNVRYYRVAYEFVYPNGVYESGIVPWPISFTVADDPFAFSRGSRRPQTRLPPPPAGYMPPGDLGKALRSYFPDLVFAD